MGANNAILFLGIFAAAGAILAAVGVTHRLGLNYTTAGILAFTSLGLGVHVLIHSFSEGLENYENQVACGGYPPGTWTNSSELNRCTI